MAEAVSLPAEPAIVRRLALLLVRHGETAWNAEARLQGQTDIPLSAIGRDQARRLGIRLQRAWSGGISVRHRVCGAPDVVFSSDLQRAAETARIALDLAFEGRVPPQIGITCDLRERFFGKFEGLTANEAAGLFPGETHHDNGETYEEVSVRMVRALQQVWDAAFAAEQAEGMPAESKRVAMVVGHGGSLRALISHAIGTGPDGAHAFTLGNTALTLLEFEGPDLANARGRIRVLNDTSHLEM